MTPRKGSQMDHVERGEALRIYERQEQRRTAIVKVAASALVLIDMAALIIGVVVMVNFLSILNATSDAGKHSACATAASRAHPKLLQSNAELQKALEYGRVCDKLNGVKASPIKLPSGP